MAFLDKFKKTYECPVICFNCGASQICRVPKGITIDAHLASENSLCENCGTPCLRRVQKIPVSSELRKPLKQYIPKPITQQPILRQPERPTQHPQKSFPPQTQRVDYPVTQQVYEPQPPVMQDFSLGTPKKINLWTGKEEK